MILTAYWITLTIPTLAAIFLAGARSLTAVALAVPAETRFFAVTWAGFIGLAAITHVIAAVLGAVRWAVVFGLPEKGFAAAVVIAAWWTRGRRISWGGCIRRCR